MMRDRGSHLVFAGRSRTNRSAHATALCRLRLPLLAAIMLVWPGILPTQAQTVASPSAGCNAANAGTLDRNLDDPAGFGFTFVITAVGGGFNFAAGEVLTFTYGASSGTNIISLSHDQSGQAVLNSTLSNPNLSVTVMFAIPASGANSFGGTVTVAAEGSSKLTVLCTQTADNTPSISQVFLDRRIQLLITEEPDRPRLIRREPGRLYNDGTGVELSAYSASAGSRLEFASSLGGIAQAMAYANDQKLEAAGIDPQTSSATSRSGLDIWVEGHYSFYDYEAQNVGSSGEFGVVYFGADMLLTPDILVGALVQYDWITDQSNVLNSRVSGKGWMAGPYFSARLLPNLYFDARAAWGQSSNDIRSSVMTTAIFPLGGTTVTTGIATGSYDTDRWLVRGNLTGNLQRGDWRFTPSVSVTYLEESHDAFTTSSGTLVASQTYQSGRVTFGPEVARRTTMASGTTIEPHVALTGVWNYTDNGSMIVGQTIVSPDDLYARVEGGILVTAVDGKAVRLTGSYDGIGRGGFHSYGAQLWVNVPLN